jgi:hypothetical protein
LACGTLETHARSLMQARNVTGLSEKVQFAFVNFEGGRGRVVAARPPFNPPCGGPLAPLSGEGQAIRG